LADTKKKKTARKQTGGVGLGLPSERGDNPGTGREIGLKCWVRKGGPGEPFSQKTRLKNAWGEINQFV